MNTPIDILHDLYGDLLIANGTFVNGDATEHHQRALLMTHKGQWRQHPDVGVGIEDFLDDEGPEDMLREIRKQFVRDGMDIDLLRMEAGGKLNVKATYR